MWHIPLRRLMKLSDIKNNLNKRVRYHDTEYIFESVTVTLSENGYSYSANCRDIKAKSSYVITDILSVDVIEE